MALAAAARRRANSAGGRRCCYVFEINVAKLCSATGKRRRTHAVSCTSLPFHTHPVDAALLKTLHMSCQPGSDGIGIRGQIHPFADASTAWRIGDRHRRIKGATTCNRWIKTLNAHSACDHADRLAEAAWSTQLPQYGNVTVRIALSINQGKKDALCLPAHGRLV